MRFVSPYGKYKIGVINGKEEKLADGSFRTIKDGYVAEFTDADFTDVERQKAYDTFGKTLTKGSRREESGAASDSDWRIGTFDTLTIRDTDLRNQVETFLLEDGSYGHDFVAIEKIRTAPPWPKYDDLKAVGRRSIEDVARLVVERVEDLGLDTEQVIQYERENLNREPVIQAVHELVDANNVAPIEVTV